MEVVKVPGKKRGSTYYTCEADRGFFYRSNKTTNDKFYLVCVEKGCTARACCDESLFTKLDEGHNHLRDSEKEAALVLRNSMVKAAGTTSEDVKSIFIRQSASTTVNVASKLSKLAFPATSKTMRRERNRSQPLIPRTLEEYGTLCRNNERFGKIKDREFCRGAIGEGNLLSVLFLSEDLKHLLAEAKEIHLDGTFKTRPRKSQSSQLLTIIVVHYGYAFPCAFAVMASRKTEAYDNVFRSLKEIVPQFQPQLIMTDYEMSLVNSLARNFPDSRKTGCFFHYCQAVLRKARALGMSRVLKTNKDAKKGLKMIMGVALLPPNAIEVGVSYVTNYLFQKNLREDFQTLLRYHRSQWLEKVGAEALSVFNRARRTNNDNESFHASLQRLIRIRSPSVWQFTERLQEITAHTASELRAFIHEGEIIRTMGKRKYRLNDARIKRASTEFNSHHDVGKFLNSTSYCVEQLFQNSFAEEEESYDVGDDDEEFLLASLAGDVPVEFHIGNTDTNEAEPADVEAAEAEAGDEQLQSDPGRRNMAMCMICQTTPPTTLVLPCRHFGLCDECCTTRQRLNDTPARPEDVAYDNVVDHSICPIDKIIVEQYIKVVAT